MRSAIILESDKSDSQTVGNELIVYRTVSCTSFLGITRSSGRAGPTVIVHYTIIDLSARGFPYKNVMIN